MAQVTDVEHVGGRVLRETFSDDLVREPDFASSLVGVLATIDDDETFADARVDSVAGTVSWPNGIDLDPDVLHGDQQYASNVQPHLRREYRLQQSGWRRRRCCVARSRVPTNPDSTRASDRRRVFVERGGDA